MAGRCKHTFRPGCEDLEGRKLLSFSGTYYVFNNYSDKVLDDTNASKSDWNQMQQFHLNGNTAQQWAFVQIRDGNYLIVNQRSGKALDVTDGSIDDGATIIQSLFQKPYAVVRLRGRLYRNRSRYFAPVSRRSIN